MILKPQFKRKLIRECREWGYPPDLCTEAIEWIDELLTIRISQELEKIITR